jgi:prefoldin subunit 5
MHHSNLYNDAPMPWMQRITWSGVAMHAGNLPGYPASHGCIRLPYNFSKSLFGITPMATRVIVARDDVSPVPFTHPLLFTPLPPAATQPQPAPGPMASAAGLMEPARLGGPSTADVKPAATPVVAVTTVEGRTPRRTRDQIAAERASRIATLTADLKTAEAQRLQADPAAKATAMALHEARIAQRQAKMAADKLVEAQQKIARQIASVNADLSALVKSNGKITTDEAIDRAADRERVLEEKLLALGVEADKARADVEAQAPLVAEAGRGVENAEKARVAAIETLKKTADTLRQTKLALDTALREEANRAKPISILISRKTGKLHVRQGMEDLFDTPITIEGQEHPFGTHVLTALELTNGERELRWNAVTVKGNVTADEPKKAKKGKKDEVAVQPVTHAPAQTPAKALERVKIPDEALEKIAEFIKPGSSVIITDNGISHETGKGTDYVILTH